MIIGLAPMDGYTDCAFREITQDIFDTYKNASDKLYLWTEFMTSDGYVANPKAVTRPLLTTKKQKNVIAQIHGGNAGNLVKTIRDLNKKYAKDFIGIELNLGCPAGNIMKSGGGSELLKDKENTLKMIKELSKNSKLPFSIKTRTGLNEADKKAQSKFIIEASNYCHIISIHGRVTKQIYAGDADWDFIYDIKKKANKNCKIIGNGGITDYTQIKEKIGNLDGIMIGRAAIGNPRIFTSHIPTHEEKLETIIKHLDLMIKFNNDQTPERMVIEFRKHLFQYIKGIPDSRDFKTKLSKTTDYQELVDELKKFFDSKVV